MHFSAALDIFIDLEASPSVAHAAWRVGEELSAVLANRTEFSVRGARKALNVPEDWSSVAPDALISRLADGIRHVTSEGILAGARIVLILDESEVLLPTTNQPLAHATYFYRVLRGLAQETNSLTLVLAGVNATPAESPFLGGEDNPLFGLLSPDYLGPLSLEECKNMVKAIGRKMQVRWEDAPLTTLATAVGGHPLLARLLATDVVTKNPERPLRPNTTHVANVARDFPRKNSAIFEQMLQSLKRYYPDELDFLFIVASGEIKFASDFADENPAMLNHLIGYGVIDGSLNFTMPVFAEWLRRHRKST